MFKPGLRLSRFFRTLAVVLFAATMLPIPGHAATERPIDFSAGLLAPADLTQFGFEDYGVDTGRFYTMSQMVRDIAGTGWDDPDINAFGVDRIYMVYLYPTAPADEEVEPNINFSSIIFVYEDEEHAEEGYAFYDDESEDPTATDLENAPLVGDDSEMTEFVDVWEEDDRTWDYHGIDFSFRIGNVTATVTANGYDLTVDRDDVEAIGEFYFEKLATLIEEGTVNGSRPPALDLMVPRYEADEVLPSRSHYCALDGEVVPHAFDPQADEISTERIERYGLVASYCNIQKLLLTDSPADYLLLNLEPLRFRKAKGAAEYIATTIEESADNYPNFDAAELDADDLPFAADEAWMVTYDRTLGDYDVVMTELIVRNGKFVYEVRLSAFEAPEADVTLDIMTDMVNCGDAACTATLELPDSVLDFIEDQAELYADL